LAELTVALKLNQGVRQWRFIIGGVLFFDTFFCTGKRKYIAFLLFSNVNSFFVLT